MEINEFIVKDVRCFAGEQKFNVRPITFLMGENSTGKSTFLACIQVLHSVLSYKLYSFIPTVDFNSAPYEMGTFSDIVHRVGALNDDGVKEFALGFNVEYGTNKRLKYVIVFSENKVSSDPVILRVEWQFEDGKVTFKDTETSPRIADITYAKRTNEFIVSGDLFSVMNFGIERKVFMIMGEKKVGT